MATKKKKTKVCLNSVKEMLLMLTKPLTNLISQRGFERYKEGLHARFAAYRFSYSHDYYNATENASLHLNVKSQKYLGQVVVWESGDCELKAVDATSGEIVFFEHYRFNNEDDFHSTFAKLIIFMRDS